MSCPDWRRLGRDDEFLRPGSAARRDALEHSEGCPACRRQALRLDPSLAVTDTPAVEATAAEVEAIKRNVLAARRMRRTEREARPRRARARFAAVAGLTLVALLFAEDTGRRSADAPAGVEAPASLLSEDYRLYGSLPLVESLEPAEARVYQLGRDDFSVVWIVDESIEVPAKP